MPFERDHHVEQAVAAQAQQLQAAAQFAQRVASVAQAFGQLPGDVRQQIAGRLRAVDLQAQRQHADEHARRVLVAQAAAVQGRHADDQHLLAGAARQVKRQPGQEASEGAESHCDGLLAHAGIGGAVQFLFHQMRGGQGLSDGAMAGLFLDQRFGRLADLAQPVFAIARVAR